MSEYYDSHYASMKVQPIKVIERMLPRLAFLGFLWGNATKYHLRAGNKQGESYEKDIAKRDRYFAWHYHADVLGEKINPELDYDLPEKYKELYIREIDFQHKMLQPIR